MIKNLIIFFFILMLSIFQTGCERKNTQTQKCSIVVSNWIGYAPLLFAYENGDLDKLNVEIIVTTSLYSSALLFKKNNYDGICSTQKEISYINQKKQKLYQLTPITIFNRSYGGDVILSNIPKEKLLNNPPDQIDVFLEKHSITQILFENFQKMTKWNTKYNLHYINQYDLLDKNINENTLPKLIVTYEPYATKLKKSGFYEIDSTKNEKLVVFDFLSIKNNSLTQQEINYIQSAINNSIVKLQKDPKSFYNTIKIYFDTITYDEFITSLDVIQFFDKNKKEEFLSLIKQKNIFDNIYYLKDQ